MLFFLSQCNGYGHEHQQQLAEVPGTSGLLLLKLGTSFCPVQLAAHAATCPWGCSYFFPASPFEVHVSILYPLELCLGGSGAGSWLSPTQRVCSQQVQGGGMPWPPATQVGNWSVTNLLRHGACVPLPALGSYFGKLLLSASVEMWPSSVRMYINTAVITGSN